MAFPPSSVKNPSSLSEPTEGMYGLKSADGKVVRHSKFQDETEDTAALEEKNVSKTVVRLQDSMEEKAKLARIEKEIERKLELLKAKQQVLTVKNATFGATTKCEKDH